MIGIYMHSHAERGNEGRENLLQNDILFNENKLFC